MLSLKWFKSAIERTIEKVVENKIEQAFNELDNQEGEYTPSHPSRKPYLNIKMVNDTLTVVMNDGNILTKAPATSDDFNAARDCKSESCLFDLVSSQELKDERKKAEAERQRAINMNEGAKRLGTHPDFEFKDGSVYLKGISRSLPPLLVEEFIAIIGKDPYTYSYTSSDEFQGLKRFFMWCCLNPRAEVSDKLFTFLKKNSFKITKQGFFVALRNIVTLHGSTELVHFVSNAYNKVKAVWKKKPDDYTVFLQKDGTYKLVSNDNLTIEKISRCEICEGEGTFASSKDDEEAFDDDYTCPECNGEGEYIDTETINHGENLGGLTDLYLDLPNRSENRFTDAHTKTFDIRIGRPVNMPMEKCRWNTDDCGAEGLHFTSDEIHYVGCGDTSVLILINPMKVVGIGESKGRCYEYLPIMTVAREEATEILHDLDFDTLELDESYAVRELENLVEKAKDGFVTEAKKYDFKIPAISTVDVQNIVQSLDEIRQEISKRVVKID